MQKIFNLIKKSKVLYGIGMIVKNRNDEDYLDLILNKKLGVFTLYGDELKDKGNCFIIEIDNDKVAGFFALIRTVLSGLYIADVINLKPYIKITKSLYNLNNYDNLYEYFFSQPINENYKEIREKYNCFRFERKQSCLVDNNLIKNYDLVNGYDVTDDYINKMSKIYKKYVVLNEAGKDIVNSDVVPLLGQNKVLGVHVRGTDFSKGIDGHPVLLTVDDYFKYIDKVFNEYDFQKIFVATDETKILEKFKIKYKEKVICFNDVHRSDNDSSVHSQIKAKGMNGYQIAREVTRDMLALSYCDGLIAGKSQVSIVSRIAKRAHGERYDFEKIIDKGNN